MKIAVIDMGTNTFHLIIVDVVKSGFQIIYREQSPVKIGERGINLGVITDEAVTRALTCLRHFRKKAQEKAVNMIFATATSAIRNASNREGIINLIKKETGIGTKVISGLQEAEYIYHGVKKALKIGKEPALIMDIGGGSTEFVIGTEDEILWKQSFEIGGRRMIEKFQISDPVQKSQIMLLESYLGSNLDELFVNFEKYRPKALIGSSGTFDTLSDMYRLQNNIEKQDEETEYPLTIEGFQKIFPELLKKNRKQRLLTPGMSPLRADMIVVACILINYLIKKLEIKQIRVSAYALKEGVLLRTLDLHGLRPDKEL